MKDLVVLVSDQNMKYVLKGLLARPQALGIHPINIDDEKDIIRHPEHDPGCANSGVTFLADFAQQYRYGLLMFDHEGSGKETRQPQELQETLNKEFARSAWGERARAVVLSPELEVWIWSDSPHVDAVAGWKNRKPSLRHWLIEQDWLQEGANKPERPKEAFEAALRTARKPRSSSLYLQIAEKVSLKGCTDRAFRDFKKILRCWFPRDVPY